MANGPLSHPGEDAENLLPVEFETALLELRSSLPDEIRKRVGIIPIEGLERQGRNQKLALEAFRNASVGSRVTVSVFSPVSDILSDIWTRFGLNEKPSDDPMFEAFLALVDDVVEWASVALADKKGDQEVRSMPVGVSLVVNGRQISDLADLPPGVSIGGMRGNTKAATDAVMSSSGGGEEVSSGGRVALMGRDELGKHILSFEKGTMDDGTAVLLMGRVKQLKNQGGMEPYEALKMITDIDARMTD